MTQFIEGRIYGQNQYQECPVCKDQPVCSSSNLCLRDTLDQGVDHVFCLAVRVHYDSSSL